MARWSFLLTLWGVAGGRAQYAVPVYAAPPVLSVVMPALAVAQPRAAATTTSTTTTTKVPRNVAVAVPVPLPFPMPAHAAPRPAACPPCLCSPSCTPAFFSYCSPCHQKCRCRDPADAPQPLPPLPPAVLPVPVPGPPPVLVVPFPPLSFPHPRIKHKPTKYTSSDASGCASSGDSGASSDSATSSDTDYLYKRARKQKSRRKRRRHPARRSGARPRGDERVQPVLTYLSRSGDIKYKARISEAEAARLLGGRAARPPTGGPVRRALRPGKKEIVFRPPAHKSISNLSVSFQITK